MRLRILSLLSILLLSTPAVAKIGTVDGVAFVVNNEVITLSEWQKAIEQAQLEMSYLPPSARISDAQLKKQVSDYLIAFKFQQQFARKMGIEVSDYEVTAAINDIAARNESSAQELLEFLRYQGITYDEYHEDIRGQMLAARLQNEVARTVQISDQELDMYMRTAEFQKIKEQMLKEQVTQHKVSHILIAVSKDKSEEAALNEAKRLYQRLQAGENFADLARAQSQDPVSAADNGLIGWVGPGQLAAEFEQVMNRLGEGELSEPVRTPYGYHLILVEKRRVGVSDEEMVRDIAREYLFRNKSAEHFNQWLTDMMSEVHIERRI